MSLRHRLVAIASSLALLQLMLLGSWTRCDAHMAGTHEVATSQMSDGSTGMHGMHGSTASSTNGGVIGERSTDAQSSTPTGDDGCNGQTLPGMCAAMPICAGALSTPASIHAAIRTTRVSVDLPEPCDAERSLAIAPEPPPPRA